MLSGRGLGLIRPMLTTVDFREEDVAQYGLKGVLLHDLRPVVVLAGPNGGGKSRFLRQVEVACNLFNEKMGLHSAIFDPTKRPEIRPASFAEMWLKDSTKRLSELSNIRTASAHASTVASLSLYMGDANVELPDPRSMTELGQPELKDLFAIRDIREIHGLRRVILHQVARSQYRAKHPDHASDETLQSLLADVDRMNAILRDLLGSEVVYKMLGSIPMAFMGERMFDPQEHSLGQRVLLTWALYIFNHTRVSSLAGTVMRVDEPEIHLHPSSLIDVIGRLKNLVTENGAQLWIATHCPSLIASLYREASVYYVADGSIEYAGDNLDKLQRGLFGDSNARHELRDFLDEPDIASGYRFLAECLQHATVANVSGDPQSKQLAGHLRSIIESDKQIRLLDYASGKARFARAIFQAFKPEDRTKIDYFTWDQKVKDDRDLNDRQSNVKSLYPEGDLSARCSTEISDFENENQVDLVVACNFLHEVPHRDWRTHLAHIRDVLKPNGRLLVMEDREMPVGELPHRNGFIVLDLKALRDLMGSSTGVEEQGSDPRLGVTTITREALAKSLGADFPRRMERALVGLYQRETERVRRLRDQPDKTYKTGRNHARSAMSLVNITLALDEMGVRLREREGMPAASKPPAGE